jgi:hypothetical protein
MLRHEVVEIGRQRAVVLQGVEPNRARVLLASEGKLGFALACHLLPPGGKERRYPHCGDGHADEQSDQNVAAVVQSRAVIAAGRGRRVLTL